MIVKNESQIIRRCLNSVKKLIDYWVIVDTGSSDGTQQVISEALSDIPGELFERPWVDFETNRNQALTIAKNRADFLLFIDADEELIFSDDFAMPEFNKDYYVAAYHHQKCILQRVLMIDARLKWKWEGVVHETLECDGPVKGELLTGVFNLAHHDGNRSQDMKKKFLNDAKILEKALLKDPENSRYVFHLAGSYESAQEYALALQYYEKRAAMGGFEHEVYFSLYRGAVMQERLSMAPERLINSYLAAFQYRPKRAEPLYCLANYFIRIESYFLGYILAKYALENTFCDEYFYTQTVVYDYGLLVQLSECAFRIGQYREAYDALKRLLAVKNLPPDIRAASEKNFSLPVFLEFRNS
jgi:glycosyltransferase involved in cell wall biosynthesis